MPEHIEPDTAGVYGAHARGYLNAGWQGVLPLPPQQKKPVPTGFTGRGGEWPGGPDIWTWMEDHPNGNIALRLPEHVIGIDVDAYPGKPGALTLANTEHRHGKLPATWRTTSRDDGVSGIRLFTIPEGLEWPNEVGPGIEIIRYAHRYAIVWPSTHPDTGSTYRWVDPNGITQIGNIPTVDDLPALPQAWVEHLTGGREDTREARTPLNPGAAEAALELFNTGPICRDVQRGLTKRVTDLQTNNGARHENMLLGTERLIRLGIDGHTGVVDALHQLRAAFLTAVAGERTGNEAELEWDRSLQGALANVHTVADNDPCIDPLRGLVDRATTTPAAAQPSNPAQPGAEESRDAPSEPSPSWEPINLTGYIDGTYQPPTPVLLHRTDGPALIYAGLVHDFHGESESGKSLVAQWEVATVLKDGGTAAYIDFESDPGQLVDRLRHMGVTEFTRFRYIRPELSPYAATEIDAWTHLLAQPYDLVILDGVTDALGQFGGSSKENDDIATWHRMVPRTIATRTGAAVILIDHVTKNTDTRGRFALGGQTKMAAIDGASYVVEVAEPIGKGLAGTVVLRVAKDRPGAVRPHCGRWRSGDRTQEAARVGVDSTGDGIVMHIQPPTTTVGDGVDTSEARAGRKPDSDTWLMEQISKTLENSTSPMTKVAVVEHLKKNKQRVMQLIDRLEEGGFVIRRGDGWRSSSVYRERSDPASPRYEGSVSDVI